MLTAILIIGILILLLGIYILVVVNNGFTVIDRNIKSQTIKNDVLTKKCDEIVSKYSQQVRAITSEIRGQ